jgi:hypothetical protein
MSSADTAVLHMSRTTLAPRVKSIGSSSAVPRAEEAPIEHHHPTSARTYSSTSAATDAHHRTALVVFHLAVQ